MGLAEGRDVKSFEAKASIVFSHQAHVYCRAYTTEYCGTSHDGHVVQVTL